MPLDCTINYPPFPVIHKADFFTKKFESFVPFDFFFGMSPFVLGERRLQRAFKITKFAFEWFFVGVG